MTPEGKCKFLSAVFLRKTHQGSAAASRSISPVSALLSLLFFLLTTTNSNTILAANVCSGVFACVCSLAVSAKLSESSESSVGAAVNARFPAVHSVFLCSTAAAPLPSALFSLSVKCRWLNCLTLQLGVAGVGKGLQIVRQCRALLSVTEIQGNCCYF